MAGEAIHSLSDSCSALRATRVVYDSKPTRPTVTQPIPNLPPQLGAASSTQGTAFVIQRTAKNHCFDRNPRICQAVPAPDPRSWEQMGLPEGQLENGQQDQMGMV